MLVRHPSSPGRPLTYGVRGANVQLLVGVEERLGDLAHDLQVVLGDDNAAVLRDELWPVHELEQHLPLRIRQHCQLL